MILGGSRWCALAGAVLFMACAASAPMHPATAVAPAPEHRADAHPYVILVSFDAFRHDYIERLHPPAFEAVATRGMRTEALVPSFPSKTFPNHYTLVTGLYPGHHGIVGNAFYDPARRQWYRLGDSSAVRDGSWYGGEPIWVTAERNGVHSAAYFWPGSEAAIGGVRPSIFLPYNGKTPDSSRVDGAIGWLRRAAAERPHLVLLYMSDVDDTTHRYGPEAPQTASAVANVDRALQRLLDSVAVLPIRDSVNVVLVSDHGMTAVSRDRVIPVFDALLRAGVDTAGILASDNGPTMSLWFGGDSVHLRLAHAALASALSNASVYSLGEIPARYHMADNPRAGDLMIVAQLGYTLLRHATDRQPSGGAHGYDPAYSDMQGILMAAGPNIRPAGIIPPVENVNVYGFVAALLRLQNVPRVDGDAQSLISLVR